MHRVSITHAKPSIGAAVLQAVTSIGGPRAFVQPGDRVIIKPNLNGAEGFTHPGVTTALVALLRDCGVREVSIAESSFGRAADTDRFFQATGYADLAQALEVKLINLNRSQAVEVAVPDPLAVATVRLAREVLEADRLINVPNLKVHYATGLTGAMKNLKGVLVRAEKRRFHEVALEPAIADLNCVLRPALNVVDAISCMEAMGPRGGDLVEMGLILAGAEAAAVDWVAAQVIGFQPEEIKHLRLFLERTKLDTQAICVSGESIRSVRRPLRRAEVRQMIPPGFTVHDGGACSACMGAFLLSCSFLPQAPAFAVEVYLGRKAVPAGVGEAVRVAFGNCCPKEVAAEVRVPGCPPYPFALAEALVRERPESGPP